VFNINIRNNIKGNKFVQKGYKYFRIFLSTINPTLNTKVTYLIANGKRINLEKPQTFSEKLVWLKLNIYFNNPLVTQCADKYLVRNYVMGCGYGELLNDLIGVWESVEDVEWSLLPEKFVLKCNHGSGYNIICTNKKNFDIEEAQRKLRSWMKQNYWKEYAEVNYKDIQKKIICEKYLDTNQGFLPYDYKFYCFNGKVQAVLVIMNRGGDTQGVFMSPEWKLISYVDKYIPSNIIPEKPSSLKTMIEASEKLSQPFPFVRVDFYDYNNRAIFGEMTFTPAGGLYISETKINGITMGDLLDLPL
jgi:hypothetical protein